MRNAKYIGRVGGLAVALGVGVAVATTPGVAWADDTGSTSAEGSPGTAGATGTGGTSESQGSSTTTETTPEPSGTSTAAGTEMEGASSPGSGSVNASESGTSASTGASVRQVPLGMALSTGGADSSTKSNSETSANGDVAAAVTTDDSTLPKPVADSTATNPEAPVAVTAPAAGPRGSSNRQQQRVDKPTGAPGVDANTLTATGNAVPSRPEISQPPRTVVDVGVQQPAAQQPVTAVNTRTYLPSQANVVAQAISAARTEPTEPRSTVSAVVLAALATAGLGPLAPNGPLTPVDSPLELALMAVGTRPRQFGQPVAEETQSLPVSPTLTSQAIDPVATAEQQTFATAPSAFTQVKAAPQTKPDTKAPTVSLTAPATGATVSGTVTLSATATDNVAVAGVQFLVDNAPLGDEDTTAPYSVAWNTTTATNGTHLLTARARDAAGNTTTSTVSVTVNNPDITAPTVSLTAPATGATVSGTVTLSATATDNVAVAGVQFLVDNAPLGAEDTTAPYGPVSWNTTTATNGTHLLTARARDAAGNTTTSTVSVTVDNSPTGQTTIAVGQGPVAVAVSGSRAYVANYDGTVSAIDTATNTVITTIPVGAAPRNLAVSPNGNRVYVANSNANTVSVIATNTNTVVDTIVVGVPQDEPGEFSRVWDIAVSPDGSRVYVTATGGTVSVINTTSHAVSGPYAAGPAATGIAVSPDGSRLYVATELWNSNITVMDTATMTVIGTVFVGESYYPIDGAFTADGKRLYMITGAQGEAAQMELAALMVIDTDPTSPTYNTVIAGFSGYDLGGSDFISPSDVTFSSDGSRAYVNDSGGNMVTVIDTSTNAVVGHITTNLSPASGSRRIAISPDGDTLYITDSAADTVVTVSVASMTSTTL
jgi:YVTN family beta-propeller protein